MQRALTGLQSSFEPHKASHGARMCFYRAYNAASHGSQRVSHGFVKALFNLVRPGEAFLALEINTPPEAFLENMKNVRKPCRNPTAIYIFFCPDRFCIVHSNISFMAYTFNTHGNTSQKPRQEQGFGHETCLKSCLKASHTSKKLGRNMVLALTCFKPRLEAAHTSQKPRQEHGLSHETCLKPCFKASSYLAKTKVAGLGHGTCLKPRLKASPTLQKPRQEHGFGYETCLRACLKAPRIWKKPNREHNFGHGTCLKPHIKAFHTSR